MTPDDLITKKDLEAFKKEIIALLKPITETTTLNRQKWLRSQDVRKMLNVSPGTLQNLRVTGELTYNKVGKIFFYKADDIEKMLSRGEKKSPKKKS